jgi:putative transposase
LWVRSGGKDAGTATPHHITRHAHPKARPEPLPGDDAPRATGIDYLALLGDLHGRQVAGRVNYAALARDDQDDNHHHHHHEDSQPGGEAGNHG